MPEQELFPTPQWVRVVVALFPPIALTSLIAGVFVGLLPPWVLVLVAVGAWRIIAMQFK